jgi:hypothetical protein
MLSRSERTHRGCTQGTLGQQVLSVKSARSWACLSYLSQLLPCTQSLVNVAITGFNLPSQAASLVHMCGGTIALALMVLFS